MHIKNCIILLFLITIFSPIISMEHLKSSIDLKKDTVAKYKKLLPPDFANDAQFLDEIVAADMSFEQKKQTVNFALGRPFSNLNEKESEFEKAYSAVKELHKKVAESIFDKVSLKETFADSLVLDDIYQSLKNENHVFSLQSLETLKLFLTKDNTLYELYREFFRSFSEMGGKEKKLEKKFKKILPPYIVQDVKFFDEFVETCETLLQQGDEIIEAKKNIMSAADRRDLTKKEKQAEATSKKLDLLHKKIGQLIIKKLLLEETSGDVLILKDLYQATNIDKTHKFSGESKKTFKLFLKANNTLQRKDRIFFKSLLSNDDSLK